jgi:hexosaminidase
VLADLTPAGTVALSAEAPGEIRYTLDGSEPTPASALYGAPLAPAAIKAALYVDGARAGPVLDRSAASFAVRASQALRLCNDRLALNLEGPPGPGHAAYFVNPVDACWIWPAADLDKTRRVSVSFARLAFNFALDPAHNSAIAHPPRTPLGEIEVRQDNCLADPLAVAPLPPGAAGARGEVTLTLPPRSGRHDLCITTTGRSYDPVIAVDEVRLAP